MNPFLLEICYMVHCIIASEVDSSDFVGVLTDSISFDFSTVFFAVLIMSDSASHYGNRPLHEHRSRFRLYFTR